MTLAAILIFLAFAAGFGAGLYYGARFFWGGSVTPLIERLRTTKSHRIRQMEKPRVYITIVGTKVDITDNYRAAWQAIANVLQWGAFNPFSMRELIFHAEPDSPYSDFMKYMCRYPIGTPEKEQIAGAIEYIEAYAAALRHHHSHSDDYRDDYRPDPLRPAP